MRTVPNTGVQMLDFSRRSGRYPDPAFPPPLSDIRRAIQKRIMYDDEFSIFGLPVVEFHQVNTSRESEFKGR